MKRKYSFVKQQVTFKEPRLSTTTMDHDDWEPPSDAEMKLIQARRERSDKISKLMSSYLLKGYKMLGIVCPTCDTILLQDRQENNYCVACSELDSDTDKDNPVTSQSAAISMAREIELATGGTQAEQTNIKPKVALSPRDTVSVSTPQASCLMGGGQLSSSLGLEGHDDSGIQTLSMSSIDVQSWPANPDFVQPSSTQEAHPELDTKRDKMYLGQDPDSGMPLLCDPQSTSLPQVPHSNKHFIPQKHTPQSSGSSLSSISFICSNRLCEKVEWASQELKDTCSVEYSIQLCHLIKSAAEAVIAIRSARL